MIAEQKSAGSSGGSVVVVGATVVVVEATSSLPSLPGGRSMTAPVDTLTITNVSMTTVVGCTTTITAGSNPGHWVPV